MDAVFRTSPYKGSIVNVTYGSLTGMTPRLHIKIEGALGLDLFKSVSPDMLGEKSAAEAAAAAQIAEKAAEGGSAGDTRLVTQLPATEARKYRDIKVPSLRKAKFRGTFMWIPVDADRAELPALEIEIPCTIRKAHVRTDGADVFGVLEVAAQIDMKQFASVGSLLGRLLTIHASDWEVP